MSKIEWTGETWNPVVGCSLASPGCTNCYAMDFAGKRLDGNPSSPHYAGTTTVVNGKRVWTGKVARAPEKKLLDPLRRRKPTTYFVNSMGDLFHEDVPDDWIDRVFAVMALCPQHTFQVLTKRSARMRDYVSSVAAKWCIVDGRTPCVRIDEAMDRLAPDHWCDRELKEWPLPNVWLGVSCEDQRRAEERIPDLLLTPAAVRFVSAEPLLWPIDPKRWLPTMRQGRRPDGTTDLSPHFYMTRCEYCGWAGSSELCGGYDDDIRCAACNRSIRGDDLPKLDWIIVGGESGPNARPMHPDWARSIRDQCMAAGVPFFFKQWGEWLPVSIEPDESAAVYDATRGKDDFRRIDRKRGVEAMRGQAFAEVGKARAGRLLDGREWNEMPAASARETINEVVEAT